VFREKTTGIIRTNVVRVELVNADEGGNSRCSKTPCGNPPDDREFSCVKIIDNAGVELLGILLVLVGGGWVFQMQQTDP